jgi:hypothetical protein
MLVTRFHMAYAKARMNQIDYLGSMVSTRLSEISDIKSL